mgnify:CR=1 FL=1
MAQPITAFDRATCRLISQEATAALEAVAAKYGLSVTAGSGSFNPSAFTPKFTFSPMVAPATATGTTGIPKDFADKAALVGLLPTDYGKVFTSGSSKKFKIDSINLRSTKYPIMATEIRTGKTYKFSEFMIKMYLGRGV